MITKVGRLSSICYIIQSLLKVVIISFACNSGIFLIHCDFFYRTYVVVLAWYVNSYQMIMLSANLFIKIFTTQHDFLNVLIL